MRRATMTAVVLWAAVLAATASAAVQTRTVEYRAGDTRLVGYLAWDDAVAGQRPGVLVVHEWWGLNDYAKQRARKLAELGYVGFAIDMYGDGRTTADPKQAGDWAGAVRSDPKMARQRFEAALAAVRQDEHVDPQHIAAIGYCFGGTAVLQAARWGLDLKAVVSFHGDLAPIEPAQPGAVKARVVVCHGGADPFVPDAKLVAFMDEMRQAGADWQVMVYSGAQHSFTNPGADNAGMPGVKYDRAADKRSWAAMKRALSEALGTQPG